MSAVSGFWKGKKVFLTGNTGFKGSWLSIWLESLGAEVFGYALPPNTDPSLFEVAKLDGRLDTTLADLDDDVALRASMEKADPDIVIHMAAQPIVLMSYDDPLGTYRTNVLGTARVLDAARVLPRLKAILVITTDKCYENHEWVWGYRETDALGGYDPYSSSKACAEIVTASFRNSFFYSGKYGSAHSVAIATARAGNVIGGGDWAKDRLIPDIVRSFALGKKVLIRNPASIRPWQHVLEPLAGYLRLAELLFEQGPAFGEAWNFGPEESDAKPVRWIVERLHSLWPDAPGFELNEAPQPHEARYLKLDCSKSKAMLGWRPVWNLETALRKVVEWNLALREGKDMHSVCHAQIEDYMRDEGSGA
jgi:CDP-glucose 4,6-dehydratase